MSFVSLSILASFFSIFQSKSLLVLSISWYSSLHWSRLAMSATSSLLSMPIILSMAMRTFSKWPALAERTSKARAASLKLWLSLAALLMAAYAWALGLPWSSSWRREGAMSRPVSRMSMPVSLPALMAEAKSSRASSLMRISIALEMPSSSSSRRLLRVVHSSCLAWQAAFVTSKNLMSASFCATVSSYMFWVSARRCSASAFSPSFFNFSASSSLSCLVFMAMNFSKFMLEVDSA
mmetsp:Transcript_120839/g.385836  ORF Transcript_120839/g.385836 Transcript_120839/m.385836 type:complete len:236 (+) Transcript_120839:992-1699(+)